MLALEALLNQAMNELNVATRRGTVLNGALFLSPGRADTLVIAITGIHGNFYSNPFYYDIGDALNVAGVDFAYAQTRNAFGVIRTQNAITEYEEVIGSWNERFADTDEDVAAYLDDAERRGYRHIVLAGHSLGANKVIYYLSRHHDPRVEHFILMSPANVDYMTGGVTRDEREIVARAHSAVGSRCRLPRRTSGGCCAPPRRLPCRASRPPAPPHTSSERSTRRASHR